MVVLDVEMPLMNGLEAGRRIKKLVRSVRIVYLTMNTDMGVAAEAFRGGASGYLPKISAAAELAIAVREVLKGKQCISPMVTTCMRTSAWVAEESAGRILISMSNG